jgi:flagellar biosynthesis/type III secretory pathway chaperone
MKYEESKELKKIRKEIKKKAESIKKMNLEEKKALNT